jgi:hypothetical protein
VPTQVFGLDGAPLLVPDDPTQARVDSGTPRLLVLTGRPHRAGELTGWVTLTGALYQDVSLDTRVSADEGVGVVLRFGVERAGDEQQVVLSPGEAARLGDCRGEMIGEDAFAGAVHAVALERRGGEVRVSLDGAEVLSCPESSPRRGAVGVGLVGSGELRLAAFEARR